MNVNLISPTDSLVKNSIDKTNGHRYTIRFKEDIIIPANSKIQLNYATLSRQSEISFLQDQILYINIPAETTYIDDTGTHTFKNILPTNHLDSGGVDTAGTVNYDGDILKLSAGNKYEVPIPKGFYTFERFYDTLTKGINKALDFKKDGTTDTTSNNQNYRSIEILDTNKPNNTSVSTSSDLSEGAVISIALLENHGYTTDRGFNTEEINQYDFEVNGSHRKNASVVNVAGEAMAFCKTNATLTDATATLPAVGAKVYDSYAYGVHNYRHTGLDDMTPLSALNIFEVKTNKTIQQFNDELGSVAFGLGSVEVANGITGANGVYPADDIARTKGENIAENYYPVQQSFFRINTADGTPLDDGKSQVRKIPAGFITIVITAENDANGAGGGSCKAEIYVARKTAMGTVGSNAMNIGSFRSIHDHIGGTGPTPWKLYFNKLRRIGLTTLKGFEADDLIHLGLQLYQKRDEGTFGTLKQRTYYRLLNLANVDYKLPVSLQDANCVLYDSFSAGNNNNYIPNDFFFCNNPANLNYTTGATNVIDNKISSQHGLTPILWSNTQDYGFVSCNYRAIPKGTVDTINYSLRPMTLYNEYYLSASEEFAEMFNISTDYTASKITNTDPVGFLCPNTSIPQKQTTYAELSRGWRSRSYSIYLRGIPLQNYKNKSAHTQGGFGKQILANIPVPFKDSLDHHNTKTTGLYEPNTPIISHLYNQDLVVNKFEIDIKQMNNDMDATEIEESVVNFTILPPDDYKGNLNAVAGFKKLPPSIIPKI
tara:strand:- start:1810 stop:4116 length:2307 start_codon:yes stop_codon:yes gene_type:complete